MWFIVVLALFTFLPWILLHRQITVRQLLPGALLTTLGLVGMRIISQILFVNWLVWYSSYYGGFGIVMALFFWLMIASTIIVIAAALSPAAVGPPGGARSGTSRDCLEADRGFDPPVSDGLLERLVVTLVQIGVGPRELADRLVERVSLAEILRERDAVARARVSAGERPAAHLGVDQEAAG